MPRFRFLPSKLRRTCARCCPSECCKKCMEEQEEEEFSSSEESSDWPANYYEDDNGIPVTGFKRYCLLRNIIFGIAFLDLTVSFVSGIILLVMYITTVYRVDLKHPVLERVEELYYVGAGSSGALFLTSVLLLIAVIKYLRILLIFWMVLNNCIFILMALTYIGQIARFNILPMREYTIIFIIASLYKFVEDFIVFRWIKVLTARPRRIRREPPPEDIVSVEDSEHDEALAAAASSSSSSTSEQVRRLTHPINHAPFYQFIGRPGPEAEGGLFDFVGHHRGNENMYNRRDSL